MGKVTMKIKRGGLLNNKPKPKKLYKKLEIPVRKWVCFLLQKNFKKIGPLYHKQS
jgi:hypothetical protein